MEQFFRLKNSSIFLKNVRLDILILLVRIFYNMVRLFKDFLLYYISFISIFSIIGAIIQIIEKSVNFPELAIIIAIISCVNTACVIISNRLSWSISDSILWIS